MESVVQNTLQVDLADPVNKRHPLNQGRVLWLLTLPSTSGGLTLYDLVAGNHGMLGSFGSGNGWSSVARQGGWGSLLVNGSTANVQVPRNSSFTTSQITIAAWIRATTLSGNQVALALPWNTLGSPSFVSWDFKVAESGQAEMQYGVSGSIQKKNVTILANTWHRWCLAINNSAQLATGYIDGVQQWSVSGSGGAGGIYSGSDNLFLGCAVAGNTTLNNGYLDDVTIWNRALSAADVFADFELSRQGYPGVLNYVSIAGSKPPTQTLTISPIADGSSVGSPTLIVGSVLTISPIADGSSAGSTTLKGHYTFNVSPIADGSSVGTPTLILGKVLSITAIADGSSVGAATIKGHYTFTVTAIADGSSAGSVTLTLPTPCPCNTYALPLAGGGVLVGGSALESDTVIGGGVLVGGSGLARQPNVFADAYTAVWLLQESGSGTAREYVDQSPNSYGAQGGGGVLAAVPTRESGGVFCRYSQELSGKQFITCPTDDLISTQPVTVSGWINIASFYQSRTLFSRGFNTPAGDLWVLQLGHNFVNQVVANVNTLVNGLATPVICQGSTQLQRDQWYHIACVWQPGNSLSVYINGVQDNSVSATATSTVAHTNGSYIGRWNSAQMPQANIQDVRVYPDVRDAAWLSAEYSNMCDPTFYSIGSEVTID